MNHTRLFAWLMLAYSDSLAYVYTSFALLGLTNSVLSIPLIVHANGMRCDFTVLFLFQSFLSCMLIPHRNTQSTCFAFTVATFGSTFIGFLTVFILGKYLSLPWQSSNDISIQKNTVSMVVSVKRVVAGCLTAIILHQYNFWNPLWPSIPNTLSKSVLILLTFRFQLTVEIKPFSQ